MEDKKKNKKKPLLSISINGALVAKMLLLGCIILVIMVNHLNNINEQARVNAMAERLGIKKQQDSHSAVDLIQHLYRQNQGLEAQIKELKKRVDKIESK